MEGYQDSSEDENDLTVVMDDTSAATGPSGEMETEEEHNLDENCNEDDIETSDEESEADLIMPVRKTKDPSPVWTCADRVEGGGAKCRFCPTILKCTKGSTTTIVNHLLKKHKNKALVKDLENAIEKKRVALKLKRLQDEKKK